MKLADILKESRSDRKVPFGIEYELPETGEFVDVNGTVLITPDAYSTGDSPTDYEVNVSSIVSRETGKPVTLSDEEYDRVEDLAIDQATGR